MGEMGRGGEPTSEFSRDPGRPHPCLQERLEALYGLERRRSEFRLEDTARLLEALGRPQDRFRSVHVAGTNGKGSVCALIERALRATGAKTGLFTSPHLVDYRERIRIGGRWPAEEELAARLAAIQGLAESRGRTFFEITTALGLDAFARHAVEWAVVEVGLGGRLDATNVLDPQLAAISSVALDHTEILGTDLAAIAREKAGIVKPGRPVVSGVRGGPAASVIAEVAAARGAGLRDAAELVRIRDVRCGPAGSRFVADLPPWGALDLEIALRGRHQVENAVTALAALSVLAAGGTPLEGRAIRDGFAAARWPGRLEPCPAEPRLWWDGAHNAEGLARLARAWREDLGFEPPAAIVFAVSRDKDAPRMLAVLRAFAPSARLFVTQAAHDRALPVETLAGQAALLGWRARAHAVLVEAVRESLAAAGRTLLAGSLFAVGEAMASLGGAPGEDQ
jgi:dihydrofolate synthase/folylpolyglutamate synthase